VGGGEIVPRLTKAIVESADKAGADYVVWDTLVPGFGLRVWPSGAKVYILKYRVGGGRKGRIRKPTIGPSSSMTVDEARSIARTWRAEVTMGGDPGGERLRRREGRTVAELADRHLEDHAKVKNKALTVREITRYLEGYIKPQLGKLRVEEVDRTDIADLHQSLKDTPYQANRVLAVASTMFGLAEKWRWRADGTNPCRHVERFREVQRERFLSSEELGRLGDVLAAVEIESKSEGPRKGKEWWSVVPAIRLLLFTGMRLSEVLTLRWEHVDLERGYLRLAESKTGAKPVYLSLPAIELLEALPRYESGWVIPGRKTGRRLVGLQHAWERIRERAGLGDVRLHDLRHTFASEGAGLGEGLPMLGRLLGHHQASTTQRYAHLAADPMKRAADRIAGSIAEKLAGIAKPLKLKESA